MATGTLKLLRFAPLITSTTSLTFAHDQHLFFTTWLHPSYRSQANALLPRWFHICLKRALWVIITLYPLSTVFVAANIYTSTQKQARLWYCSGLAFTVGHFLFGKKAVRLLDQVQYDRSTGKSTEDMRDWLDMNFLRTLVVDLPGWVSFVVAAMESLCLC